MADGPSKKDIEAIFIRLRSIPANKVCFDCNAKNPTWSSVTYGVFICIDCSAVHRGLGVHVTFVRSTQLDTNWTWLQLRQMQVGGNANATQFFTQHNCVTTDAQQKYNSRAAQLYREKLQNLAQQAINTSGKELHLHLPTEATVHEQEVDFFAEHESVPFQGFEQTHESLKHEKDIHNAFELSGEPTVNLLSSSESLQVRKPTIGGRKVQPKKSGLGAKKGLGATKVKTDFAEIEREVALADENRKKALEDEQQVVTLSTEEQEKQMTSMRLAYQDLSIKQKKEEEKLKQTDPKKAEQMERLGMGFACRSGISHSALTDMQTIEQENLEKTSTPLSKLMSRENDGFFDDYNFSSGFSMNRNSFGSSGSNNKYGGSGSGDLDSLFMYSDANIDWPEPSTPKQKPYQIAPEKEKPVQSIPASDGDTAQKKFGNAKAISSEQFFNNGSDDWERKANLSRFQGSSSISSADYFGDNQRDSKQNVANNFQTPDFDDVKESVRQGVTKVAGKLSSLANGVMSSIQDRYGY